MKKRLKLIIEATTKKSKLPARISLAALGVLVMGFGMSVIENNDSYLHNPKFV